MICETCGGERTLPVFEISGEQIGEIPCPTCGGCGLAHCCEGDQEQPDTNATTTQSMGCEEHSQTYRAVNRPIEGPDNTAGLSSISRRTIWSLAAWLGVAVAALIGIAATLLFAHGCPAPIVIGDTLRLAGCAP
jgi:hypothetical protein